MVDGAECGTALGLSEMHIEKKLDGVKIQPIKPNPRDAALMLR